MWQCLIFVLRRNHLYTLHVGPENFNLLLIHLNGKLRANKEASEAKEVGEVDVKGRLGTLGKVLS